MKIKTAALYIGLGTVLLMVGLITFSAISGAPSRDARHEKDSDMKESSEPDTRTFPPVLYLAYHNLITPAQRQARSDFRNEYFLYYDAFRKQMNYLKEHNFYPVTAKEAVNKNFSRLPDNAIPVNISFDDGSYGQVRYKTVDDDDRHSEFLLVNGKPELLECVPTIMREVWGDDARVTFFPTFIDFTFKQYAGLEKEAFEEFYPDNIAYQLKLNYIADEWELGLHTIEHDNLGKRDAQQINDIFDLNYNVLARYIGGKVSQVEAVAYPYGVVPKDESFTAMTNYSYNDGKANIKYGFMYNNVYDNNDFIFRPNNDQWHIVRNGVCSNSLTYFESCIVKPYLRGIGYNSEPTI